MQDVYCSDPAAEIVLVDWDIPPVGGDEPGVVSFPDGERTAHAFVGNLDAEPLAALAGTDIERALHAALLRRKIVEHWPA